MALTVSDVAELQTYLAGVMDRADHHAASVNEIALALVGAIVWRKDEGPIKVMTRDGDMKNVLWAHIGSKRYAFSYNHVAGTIEMRENSVHGVVLHEFSNGTSLERLKSIFAAL